MKYKIEVTKCYLVQILDEEGNEVASDYDFVQNKKEAEQTGREMIEAVKRRDQQLCKCGYCDCIFNTERYKNICDCCIDGSEYDDEEN